MVKKVLVLEDSSKVSFGGGQKITLEVCGCLEQNNHSVTIVDMSDDSMFFKTANGLFNIICLYRRDQRLDATKSSSGIFLAVRQMWLLPILLYRYFGFCRSERPQIIYSTTRLNLLIGVMLALSLRMKHVHHLHSAESSPVYRMLLSILFLFVTKVIVPSHFMKTSFSNRNIDVVYNFVDDRFIDFYFKNIPFKTRVRPLVAFIGSFLPYKGAYEFLKISKTFEVINNPVDFLILGSDPLKISDGLRVVWSHDLIESLLEVDCVVFLSNSPESFGIAALEAALCNKIVLYKPIGALPEILDGFENCYALPTVDAKIIEDSLKLRSHCKSLSLRGKNDLQKFTYDFFAQKVVDIFHAV